MSTFTRTFAACPHCGEEAGRVDHLEVTAHPMPAWHCESCAGLYHVRRKSEDDYEVTKSKDAPWPQHWFVLRLPASHPRDVILLIKQGRCPNWSQDDKSSDAYYFDEHTCPVNWFNQVEAIADGSDEDADTDPHGLFEFVQSFPAQPDEEADDVMRRLIGHSAGDSR